MDGDISVVSYWEKPSPLQPSSRGGGFLLGEKQGAGHAGGFFSALPKVKPLRKVYTCKRPKVMASTIQTMRSR
jgi:hypothetical protein